MASSSLMLLPLLCLMCMDSGHGGPSKKLTSADVLARHFNLDKSTPPPTNGVCASNHYYRSADGTCNNLANPSWGAVGRTYRRLLDPVYDDGAMTPRQRATSGDYLPSPRDVSVRVHDYDVSRPHPRGTVMLMEWGQFLAHDIAGTPVDSVEDDDQCCYDALVSDGEKHPDVDSGGPCNPIIISEGDRYFTEESSRCMQFVRSYPVTDDNGVRQQVNERSAFIDGGQVYGASDEDMQALRSHSAGQLVVVNDDNLPRSEDNYCVLDGQDAADVYCMEAGDSRVNVYPGLGALHTIFVRYHNYIAEELGKVHTDYDDETLFQEARKIVIAVLQRITYNEYLPMILGSNLMKAYGLTDPWSYDDTCDATLYNVFATAAFRFGHSMVPDTLTVEGVEEYNVDLYDRPGPVLRHLDTLLVGLVSRHAEKADRWYSEGITDQLFELVPQKGYDIASLNLQRGRDHGLPPYNVWRQFCDLYPISSFEDIRSSERFQDVYNSVEDIDLYSGALDEDAVSGGTVGETYACLLGRQFANLRNCDRFWWESEDPNTGFADKRQRSQILSSRLSHVICLTTGITEIQQDAFSVAEDSNPVQSCNFLLESALDVSQF